MLLFPIYLLIIFNTLTIFDFNSDTNPEEWRVVDDVVMGGRSDGDFYISEEGHGVFEGRVSLENNGGFSSVRHRLKKIHNSDQSKFVIHLKGDGKDYQFRAKSSVYDRHSYIFNFTTTGAWQSIEIPINEMYPAFRGRKLGMDNYSGDSMAEIAFLIANKRAETFRLEIDRIEVK